MFQIQVGRFQNISERTRILGCLIFSNLVNTNVAIFIKYQPHGNQYEPQGNQITYLLKILKKFEKN